MLTKVSGASGKVVGTGVDLSKSAVCNLDIAGSLQRQPRRRLLLYEASGQCVGLLLVHMLGMLIDAPTNRRLWAVTGCKLWPARLQ